MKYVPQCGNLHTYFSITLFLREINLRGSRDAKSALKFTKLTEFSACKLAKKAVLGLLDSPKLISHKISVIENSLCLHTMNYIIARLF